ncbi:hypothetical protein EO087_09365 [Dyella sp. M7H15-1]|uniref:hypothetical protein n=1 Tax=Dyella sp. M7H15-1 TaxID=2501295 RepID=UPI001004E994|nr:hypothetical protein [Dyella sp. M7H15-1]QAU24170.1 hypothetical protein EO087_09365 [Dyella sp. M7H15-1]
MFSQPSIPADQIRTHYLAPFGLTVLLRQGAPGQAVDSLLIGTPEQFGMILFVSSLDAEIYRLHAQTLGENWIRHPFETIAFQYAVQRLGVASIYLAFGFFGNSHRQLILGASGCLLLPYFAQLFGPLEQPNEPTTFQFSTQIFNAIEHEWASIGEPYYAQTVDKLNRMAITQHGANELRKLAEKALYKASFSLRTTNEESPTWALYVPNADSWQIGSKEDPFDLH